MVAIRALVVSVALCALGMLCVLPHTSAYDPTISFSGGDFAYSYFMAYQEVPSGFAIEATLESYTGVNPFCGLMARDRFEASAVYATFFIMNPGGTSMEIGFDGAGAIANVGTTVSLPVRIRLERVAGYFVFSIFDGTSWNFDYVHYTGGNDDDSGTWYVGLSGYEGGGSAMTCTFSDVNVIGAAYGQWKEHRAGSCWNAPGVTSGGLPLETSFNLISGGHLITFDNTYSDLTGFEVSYTPLLGARALPVDLHPSVVSSNWELAVLDATQDTIYFKTYVHLFDEGMGPNIETVNVTLTSDGAVKLFWGSFVYEKDMGSITGHGQKASTAEDAITTDVFSVDPSELYYSSPSAISIIYYQEDQDDGDIFLDLEVAITISIDECVLGTHDCGAADCVMSAGSYVCECPSGYSFYNGYCNYYEQCDEVNNACGDFSAGAIEQLCLMDVPSPSCICDGFYCGSSSPLSLTYGGSAFQTGTTLDSFSYVFKEVDGDFSMEADIVSLTPAGGSSDTVTHMCGVMVRDDYMSRSEHFIFAGMSTTDDMIYERTSDGVSGSQTHTWAGDGTGTILMARVGGTVHVRIDSQLVAIAHTFSGKVMVGIAATDGTDTGGGTCVLENVRVSGNAGQFQLASPGDPSTYVPPTLVPERTGSWISFRSLWAYDDSDTDQAIASFEAPGFDSSGWSHDFGPFGAGAYFQNTNVDATPDTVYYRNTMDRGTSIDDEAMFVRTTFVYDDGFRYYAQGSAETSIGVTSGTHGELSTASGLGVEITEDVTADTTPGSYTHAASVHQSSPSGTSTFWGMQSLYDYVNECDEGTHTCSYPYKCFNTVGSYACICPMGAVEEDGRCKRIMAFDYSGTSVEGESSDGIAFFGTTFDDGIGDPIYFEAEIWQSTTGTSDNNVCGIMVRTTLDDDASAAAIAVTPRGIVSYYRRQPSDPFEIAMVYPLSDGPVKVGLYVDSNPSAWSYVFDGSSPRGFNAADNDYAEEIFYESEYYVGAFGSDDGSGSGGRCFVKDFQSSVPVNARWDALHIGSGSGDDPWQIGMNRPIYNPGLSEFAPTVDTSNSDLRASSPPYYDSGFVWSGNDKLSGSFGRNFYGDPDFRFDYSLDASAQMVYWGGNIQVASSGPFLFRIIVRHDGGAAIYVDGELEETSNLSNGVDHGSLPDDDGVIRTVVIEKYASSWTSYYVSGQFHDMGDDSLMTHYEVLFEVWDAEDVLIPCSSGLHSCATREECSASVGGGFSCACADGTTSGGLQGCVDARECQAGTHNCATSARCRDTYGSFTCMCNTGYDGNGVVCEEIDECATSVHNCATNSTCANTPGSFTCTCDDGFSGVATFQCSSVNECSLGTHDCDGVATCADTSGSFTCSCPTEGYSGSATSGSPCTDVDECSLATHDCDGDASCSNSVGSFSCTCNTGYTGVGTSCDDLNECSLGTHDCTADATCANTAGSFTCSCAAAGWTSGGGASPVCSDIDECALATHDCDGNATCANSAGSFSCACNSGYDGVGTSCVACGFSTAFQYYEWTVSANQGDSMTCAAEFALNPAAPGGWTVSNPGGVSPGGEEPSMLIDASDASRWCDTSFSANGATTLLFDLGSPQNLTGYSYTTSSATTAADPATWVLRGSNDQSEWYTLDSVTGHAGVAGRGENVAFDACDVIDECALGIHNCHARATCTNTEGSFSCDCPSGYSGGGTVCVVDTLPAMSCTTNAHGGMSCSSV